MKAWASTAAILALIAGCAGSSSPANRAALTPLLPVASSRTIARAPGPARSHFAGTVASRAIGPFLERSPTGGLLAWIAPNGKGTAHDLDVVPVGIDGAPFGAPRAIATVPEETTSLVLRASGSTHPGWLVAWSAVLDRGEGITIAAVAPDGTVKAGPFDVERTTDHVQWADIVPTPGGGVCVWAEQTPAGDANILAAPVDADGKPRGLPVRVTRGVIGWSAVRDGDGLAMALVGPGGEGAKGAGALSWWRLDGDGRPRASPTPIGAKPTVTGDVDVVAVGKGWVLGWSDVTGEDAQVMLAGVDAMGHVTGPRHAMETVGGSSLVALASGPAGTALAWMEPKGRERPSRELHLASVSVEGPSATPVTSLDIAGAGVPELVGTGGGFGLLATARVCGVKDGPLCSEVIAPTFVRLDRRLSPGQTEPLLVSESGGPAALGWGLRCLGDSCEALAADSASPTGIFTVDLGARESPYRAPVTPPLPAGAPRVSGLVTLSSGPSLSDLATVRLGDATLVATMSTAGADVSEAKHGRRDIRTRAATVSTRLFDAEGQPLEAAATLTVRALPAGGVALAAAKKPEDGGAAAWVARDSGDLQVHVADLDAHGHRGHEVQVTTSKGDASDVALARAGDGWLVAWVDARDGNGEVYAERLDHNLQRVGREERITTAAGDASDVAVAVSGDRAWVVWSDPRESPREGLGDIYARALRAKDARPEGDEVRVLATAAHSRSPALAPAGEGALVAWIEDAPQGLDARGNAMVARLDGRGAVVGAPQPLQLADTGSPSALSMVASADGAHVFVARSHRSDVSLDAVALRADGSPASPAWRLFDLDAPGTFDVTVSAEPEGVYFDDVATTSAGHRVRRAAVEWRK